MTQALTVDTFKLHIEGTDLSDGQETPATIVCTRSVISDLFAVRQKTRAIARHCN